MNGWTQQDIEELKKRGIAEQVKRVVPASRIVICRVEPIGKPRMTQRDKWAKRPCVVKYYAYKDELRALLSHVDLTDVHTLSWTAYFPLPASWSKKKKDAMRGTSHYVKPDRDNVDKGILDALFENDSGIAHGELNKYWDDGKGTRLEIEVK
jgi:Holliday junction resolvase RusA-like endonuclease